MLNCDVSPLKNAIWISCNDILQNPNFAIYLRRSFFLNGKVRCASLKISALGVYECEINGVPVSEDVLAPGWTDYRKRVYYQTYEASLLLRAGENTLTIIVGDGWYAGHVATAGRGLYGKKPAIIALLEIVLENSETFTLRSDESWQASGGAILANDLLMGEQCDARISKPAWGDATAFSPEPIPALLPQTGPTVRRMEELKPISHTVTKTGWIYDFGQNFVGRVRLVLEAQRGDIITLRHAEILNADGTLYTENLRSAAATDQYICNGEGRECWEPKFTFHGFRYLEISGAEENTVKEITGVVLHSALASTGHFACSNPLLNQLQSNIVWSQKGNFLDVPTDCPQRDERMGWTGDAQIFLKTACFNMDVRGFFRKWLNDLKDAQRENGSIPYVAPMWAGDFLTTADGGPAWSDAIIICPWTLYQTYGDMDFLTENYVAMNRYLQFIEEQSPFEKMHPEFSGDRIGFGDWLALDNDGEKDGATPKGLIAAAFWANNADILSRVALLLGDEKRARECRDFHRRIVDFFRKHYLTETGALISKTQTSYVLALHFDLLPVNARSCVAKALADDIARRENHLTTGFVGTPYLLPVLEAHGYLDTAYRLLEQETYPSWLYPVKCGATTIWERWDGWTPEKGFQNPEMNSFNHYAYGAVGAWMYQTVAGINPAAPGYEKILFRPRPGGSLTFAEARLVTDRGEIGIRWERQPDKLWLQLTVPPDATASLEAPPEFGVPQTDYTSIPAGVHEFSLIRKISQP